MKKYLSLLFAIIIALSAASCTSETLAETTGTPVTTASAADANTDANTDTDTEADPNTVYGEISEIFGNYLTLKVIEGSPRMGLGNMGQWRGDMPDGTQSFNRGDLAGMSQDELQAMFGDAPVIIDGRGDTAGQFTFPGGGAQPPADGQTFTGERPVDENGNPVMPESGQGIRTRETQYTGEVKEVIIPVGTPIMSTTYGQDGATESEVKIETLKAGDTLLVTFDNEGETVVKVSVLPSSGTMGSGMMGQGFRIPGDIPEQP